MANVSNEKIGNLRDIILERADNEKKSTVARGHQEAEDWVARETEKLNREANLILQDARKRADDIRRRQILAAERENSTDTLRLQNRILSDSMNSLQDKLVHLRERKDYSDILAGMCIEAVESINSDVPLKLRLAAVDNALADEVISKAADVCKGTTFTFDPEPAPILGGCWISTEDGRTQVNMDWQSITQELADSLATRLLPLL
ncbi:MAG: V-type ATP synthase subunit E [Synergistes sp.]|nr:V-type ATP synthase subunit E [Synergistes sp.]